jgi:uncharacterized membrane protein (UPF0127 family)
MLKSKKTFFLFALTISLVFALYCFSRRFDFFSGNSLISLSIKNNAFRVEVVSDDQKMQKGLGGRDHLCDSCGMLFEFSKSGKYAFWMKDMQFPLDIIWIFQNKIVYIEKNVRPDLVGVLTPSADANRVLELNAGSADKLGIEIGDKVGF